MENRTTILNVFSAIFIKFKDPFNYSFIKKRYISYKFLSFHTEFKIKGICNRFDFLNFSNSDSLKQKIMSKNDFDFYFEQTYKNFDNFEFYDANAQTFFNTIFPNYYFKTKNQWILTKKIINWDIYLIKKIRNII